MNENQARLRWDQLADRILDYSVEITSGENFVLAMTSVETYPLAAALVEGAIRRGANPQITLRTAETDEAIRRLGTDEQAAKPLEIELFGMSWADVYVTLRAMVPPEASGDEDYNRRAALLQSVHGQVSAARWNQTRWCIVRVPTTAYAEYLGRSTDDLFADFVRGSADDDGWAPWVDIADRLQGTSDVRIVADDTDLSFSVAGRSWVLYDGKVNLPDGEVATAPVDDTTNGYITFADPVIYGGRRIDRMRLDFEDGRVIKVDAGPDTQFVEGVVATDPGAARVGEFGIGINRHLEHWTQDIFFDEKLVGTAHIALGRAYPECGGVNQSAIHWDIVKDLRPSATRRAGFLYIDDIAVIENGVLTVPTSFQR